MSLTNTLVKQIFFAFHEEEFCFSAAESASTGLLAENSCDEPQLKSCGGSNSLKAQSCV